MPGNFLRKFLSLIPLFCGVAIMAMAQGSRYRLNISDGLPSNHVYHIIEDSKGYLWIATDKGVVRYNGYDLKLFNLSDGLPTDDIWELLEDKKGRIWLGNISDEYGFIRNNKYHKAVVNGNSHTIYPKGARRYGNSIIFSSGTISGDGLKNVCFGRDDTISFFSLKELVGVLIFFDEKGSLLVIRDSGLYGADIKDIQAGARPVLKFKTNSLSEIGNSLCISRVTGDHLVFAPSAKQTNIFYALNIRTGKTDTIALARYGINEPIRYMHEDLPNNKVYVFTGKRIVVFNYAPAVRYENAYAVKDITTDTSIDVSKIRIFLKSEFWNKCVGGASSGMWINYDVKNEFVKEKTDLTNYKHVGGEKDEVSFWWNSSTATLLGFEKNGANRMYKLDNFDKVNSITHYNKDTFLLTNLSNYFFNRGSGQLTKLASPAYGDMLSVVKNGDYIVAISNNKFFSATRGDDDFISRDIDFDRYQKLAYDSPANSYWAYNFNKVFIHGDKDVCITGDKLQTKFGVKKTEHIAIDNRFGNVFIKGPDNISVYNPADDKYESLFPNYNLRGAFIFVYNDILIVAGRFGVLFSEIRGVRKLSLPVIYQNVKNINYNSIYDGDVLCGQVLLNTDKGLYRVTLPSAGALSAARRESPVGYKLVIAYRDTIIGVKAGDTLVMDQNSRRLQFDVINPLGNGQAKYTCRLSEEQEFHELNDNDLTISNGFVPGRYYKLSIKVYDNVWRSDPTDMYIYIQPYWYQTTIGRRLVWGFSGLLVLLVVLVSALVTRRLVIRANHKKNKRLEIELRSIYTQLNPHFIINTLNSFVHMIKKERLNEATAYIAKFSRLLRSYLDSSGNRYITLSDEITNLDNYIQLQKMRFIDAFTYEMIVDASIEYPDMARIPALLLQPIVENAIVHGLLPITDGHLRIEFSIAKERNELTCTIEDTGIGRERSRAQKKANPERKSYGDSLIKELTEVINKYEQTQIVIEYIDKLPPLSGTIVVVRIKNYTHGKI